MLRHWHIQVFVIGCTLAALSYSGGAQLAATYANHGAPAGVGTNIEVTITAVLGAAATFAFCGALLYNLEQLGDLVFGIAVGVILVAAIVTGDAWGVHWLAFGLPHDIRTHAHWYSVLLPGSATFLSWWITVSVAAGILIAYRRDKAKRQPPADPVRVGDGG